MEAWFLLFLPNCYYMIFMFLQMEIIFINENEVTCPDDPYINNNNMNSINSTNMISNESSEQTKHKTQKAGLLAGNKDMHTV